MPLSFGKTSQVNIAQLDYRLQRLLHRFADIAPKELDLTIVCGYRGEAEQNKAFAEGKSKLTWPNSAHNISPARAFDFAPYPVDWNDRDQFLVVRGALELLASQEKIPLKALISWDVGHVELA